MKTLLIIWSLVLGHCLAGPFFFGQQGQQGQQSAAWTPAALGSSVVYAWVEGSSLVAPDGTAINPWADLSGNSRNWTQATASKRPTEQTYESFRVARFDSVDDGMTGSISVSTNNFTVIACYRCASASPSLRRALNGDANWLIGPYNVAYQYFDVRSFAPAGPSVTTNFVVHSLSQFSASTPDASHWLNGTLAGSITYAGATESLTPGAINLAGTGAYLEPLNGDVYSVIVLAGTDTGNRQKCEGYLAWKVGIAASLDASHPYKYSPP